MIPGQSEYDITIEKKKSFMYIGNIYVYIKYYMKSL